MRKLALPLLLIALVLSCAKMSEEERARKAQEYYQKALKDFKEGDYKDAAWNFNEAIKFIDHLTPQQIENMKFLLAKSYYLDEDYVNAVVAFEDYVFYYPKLDRTEEAYYYLVDSYVKVAPDPYRDQEYTWKAVEKAREFLSKFPKSKYAGRVHRLIKEAYKKIAQHEIYIAEFYEDYGYTYSAAVRYREILINFSDYIDEKEIAYRYIKNLINTDHQAEMEEDKIGDLLDEQRDKLSSAEGEEERKAIERRIAFLTSEIERWRKIEEKSLKEAQEALEKYKEVYGSNLYYKELAKLIRKKNGKVKAHKRDT